MNYDGDAFPNFFGTSAAAPHAAGVAALLLETRNKYYGDVLAPDGVKAILQNTALDMNTPGYDVATGAGFILADSALSALANPSAYIYAIEYDTTLTPGVDTLLLTIYGEYLNDSSTVWLDGVPLTNGVVINGDTAIITIVDPFTGLYPEIQVNNPPLAGTNGTDGGLSNPLYFTTKETILVRVDDKSKKYGEVMPAFTADYTLESIGSSIPLDSAGLAQHEVDRIHDIDITTIATALSNVGLWGISADPSDPLSPNSSVPATDTLDISLLQRYNIVFDDGLLTIDPLDLLITPRDTTFVYNDSIVGITFDYVFNDDPNAGISIGAADSLALVNTLTVDHSSTVVTRTAVVRGTALVNSDGDQLLTDALLSGYSATVSDRVTQTRGTALVNGELIAPEELFYAVTNTLSSGRVVRGTALVNGLSLVQGTAVVDEIDSLGNVVSTQALVNSGSLVNSSGGVNSSTITLDSNTETIMILGDDDIAILSGDTTGDVVIRSVNLVTGNTVGTHLSIPGSYLTRNWRVTYGLGNITIVPDTAVFTIDPASLTQTFNGGPISVDVTVLPDSVPFTVTYNGSDVLPVNAGSYAVHVEVSDTNYVGFADAILVIQPDTAEFTIAPSSLTQTYDGSGISVDVTVLPDSVPFTVTYNGSASLPVNAGTYDVHVEANDPNFVGSLDATLVVQKVNATATTGVYVINKNAPLPAFTATYSGFINGDDATVVTSVSFSTSPNYTGNAGIYQIIVNATALNYTFTSVNGTLYVNPAGPGTKQVKPSFLCYELLSSPNADGFTHIAYFEYFNNNSAAVYIPIGPANEITGSVHDATEQPSLFLSGGGGPIAIPYMGGAITWQVSSNKNNGTTGSIPANNSNVVCTSPGQRSMIVQESVTELRVFPNPSTGLVFLEFPEGDAVSATVDVFNALGVKCAVRARPTSENVIGVDLSTFGRGLYLINVTRGSEVETHRVIIE